MKPKSKVFNHFTDLTVNNKASFQCQFCQTVYNFKNATKFAWHLTKCKNCPEEVKKSFQSVKGSHHATTPGRSATTPVELQPSTSYQNQTTLNQNDIHRAVAKAIYVTGAPLKLLEHPLWQEALKMLQPLYTPPSRRVLASTLLDQEYTEVHNVIEENVKQARVLHLAIDGWSNLRNESILNVVLYAPKPYFYKFIETKNVRHTAEYLRDQISQIIEEIDTSKFVAVITDNASNMVKCGELLQEKFGHIMWVGCLAHTLHLLVNDVLKIGKVKQIFECVVGIIKIITKSHLLSAEFRNIAESKSINISLHLPVKTRWGSYLQSLQSFIKSKNILQNMIINENSHSSTSLQKYKNHIMEDDFWNEVMELEKVLEPVVGWITRLEGDYCSAHLVHKALNELTVHLNTLTTRDFLQDEDINITMKFQRRKDNALKPVHLAAAILDPRNQGQSLSETEYIDGCELIANMAESGSGDRVINELNKYKTRQEIWQKPMLWQMAKTLEPMSWWETFFPKTSLSQIALKVLSVPVTSASVERSFSTFSHIHSKKRNRLTTKRAGKISYISHNWKLLNNATERHMMAKSSADDDSDTSSSEDADINMNVSIESDAESLVYVPHFEYGNLDPLSLIAHDHEYNEGESEPEDESEISD